MSEPLDASDASVLVRRGHLRARLCEQICVDQLGAIRQSAQRTGSERRFVDLKNQPHVVTAHRPLQFVQRLVHRQKHLSLFCGKRDALDRARHRGQRDEHG